MTAPQQAVSEVVAASGTSFYWAMRLLPRARREAMYAIYAYCRALDDVADAPGATDDKLARLEAWREEIDALYAGHSRHPVARALAAPVAAFGLERAEFDELRLGMEMDVRGEMMAPSAERLDLYCRRVAGAVGLLSVRVFGAAGDGAAAFAIHLGKALQLTNILRDLDEDAALGRLYLPRDALREAGLPPGPPAAVLAHRDLPRVCARVAQAARAEYAAAAAAIDRRQRRPLRPALAMMAAYSRLLDRLERRGWRRRQPVPRLGSLEGAWIALRHLALAR